MVRMMARIDSKHGIHLDGHKFILKFSEVVKNVNKAILRSYYLTRVNDDVVLIRIKGAAKTDTILVLNISKKPVSLIEGRVKVIILPASTVELIINPKNKTSDSYIESSGKQIPINESLQSVLSSKVPSISKSDYVFVAYETSKSNMFQSKLESNLPSTGESVKIDFGLILIYSDVIMVRDPNVIRIKNMSSKNEVNLFGPSKSDDYKLKPGEMAALEPFEVKHTPGWYVKVADGNVIALAKGVKALTN